MGIRISIGAIIAVLLGGTGYLAQQSHTTKNLLQKREVELSAEKDNTAKLNLRFKTIEQQMKGLQSRLDKEGTSAKTEIQEMSRQIAEKSASLDQEKAKIQGLEMTLKHIRTTLENERKMRADSEETNKQNIGLAANRAEEIQRLETQAQKMSQLVAEKSAGIKQEKTEIRNLKSTLDIINSSLDNERRMRAEAEKANKQNIEIASKRAEEMSRLINEKSADIKQEKTEIRNLKSTLDIINSSLNNERKARAEAEKANKQNIEIASKRAEEMSRLINEKSADIKQEKTEIRNLKSTLDIINSSLGNERKARAEAEKANKQNIGLAANRAEEIQRLETQAQKMSQLVAEKSAGIKQEKAEIRNLKSTHDIINSSLDNERKARAEAEKANKQNIEIASKRAEEMSRLITVKNTDIKQKKSEIRNLKTTHDIINSSLNNERRMRAEAEKANKQNIELAGRRAEEIRRLETQVGKMRKLIAEKTADIEQEKAKTQNLESALQQIQVALETERKTRVEIEKSHKRNLELARNRAEEMKRLEKAREIIEAQVRKMDQLIATEKEKVEKRNIADKRKSPAKAKKSNAQDAMLAKNRAEEMKRLEQTREILNTQVQEMSRLIAEKNTDIEQEKTKAQNLKLALEQIQKTLESERKARTKVEESNVQNAELARKRVEEINQLQKARELLKAQVQEMSQLIAEKTSVAELIKNKLDQTNLSLSETIKKHTLAIARSKILEKKAQEETKRSQKLASDLNEMNSRLKKQSITLERTKDLLRVTFVNNFLFDLGSAEIKEKGIEALSKVAEFLQKQKDKMIRIEGHTDNQPIKGNLLGRYPTNWELSVARAVSVVKYLESKNIAPKRLSATGHSFYRPVASNDTVEGRAKNRRTDILLSNSPPNTAAATP